MRSEIERQSPVPATCLYRHGENDFTLWDVDFPPGIIEQIKSGHRSSAESVEDLLRLMPAATDHDGGRLSLLVWDNMEIALYTMEMDEAFFDRYSHEGCSLRTDLNSILDELVGPETEINIMWDDLKPETQQRLMRMLGDNGNYDVVPITTIYAPDMDQGMQMN